MVDVPEPLGDLWDAVKGAGVAAFEYLWPPDSESEVRALADVFDGLAVALTKAVEDSGVAARSMSADTWRDAAGFHVYHHIDSFNKDLGEVVVALEGLAADCRDYAKQISDAKMAVWTEIAINVGLFALASAFGGPAGAVFAAQVARNVVGRVASFAVRVGQGAHRAAGRFGNVPRRLVGEMLQEAVEETLIDLSAQSLSMWRGYGEIDLAQTRTAAVSGAAGGVMGMGVNKLVGPVTGKLGELASGRMPGKLAEHLSKGTNSVVVNGVTSPAASIVGNGLSNGEWQGMTVGEYLGNAAAAGTMAGLRTNSQLAGSQLFEHRTGNPSPSWADVENAIPNTEAPKTGVPDDDSPPPPPGTPVSGDMPEGGTGPSAADIGGSESSEASASPASGDTAEPGSGQVTEHVRDNEKHGPSSTPFAGADRADSPAGTASTTGATGTSSPATSAAGGSASARASAGGSQGTASNSNQAGSAAEKHTDAASSREDTAADLDRDEISTAAEPSTESVSSAESPVEHSTADSDRTQTGPSEYHDEVSEPVPSERPAQSAEPGRPDVSSLPVGHVQAGSAVVQPLPVTHTGPPAERTLSARTAPRALPTSTTQPEEAAGPTEHRTGAEPSPRPGSPGNHTAKLNEVRGDPAAAPTSEADRTNSEDGDGPEGRRLSGEDRSAGNPQVRDPVRSDDIEREHGTGSPVRTPGPTHTASPIPDSGFVPDGRYEYFSDVTPGEFQAAARAVSPTDFGSGAVVSVRIEGPFVRVITRGGQGHLFQPEVGHGLINVSETTVRSGTDRDPHLVRVNHRVASEQLARTWVHEISETLQTHAAVQRPEPQGLIRRMASSLGWLADGSSRTPAPEIDPHTAARLDERLHLIREFEHTRSLEERLRLRREIAAVDRDLSNLGYPTRDLPPVDVVHQPVDDPPPPPPPGSANDHIWQDPLWRREGRQPSLDELIPTTNAEVGRWTPAVREEFARQLDGQTFGDVRVRMDLSDPYGVSVYVNSVTVRLQVIHAETGYVGRVTRTFSRAADGSLYVGHNSLRLYAQAQGQGFASRFNRFLEDWYRYSGVSHIEVHAAGEIGGYAWARAGFDWAPNTEHRSNAILGRLRGEVGILDSDAALVERWLAGDQSADIGHLRQKYGIDDPQALATELRRQQAAGLQILDQAANNAFGSTNYPIPLEIARAGWNGQTGRDASWVGKRALLGSDWKGVKPISDGGPLHPRSEHTPPATPDGPVDGDHFQRPDDGTGHTHPASPIAGTDSMPGGRPAYQAGEGKLRGVADVLLQAVGQEPGISRVADEAAAVGGVAESRPGRPEAEARVRSRVRYSVELSSESYVDGVRRIEEGLITQGYRPIRLNNGWVSGRVGGVVSHWRDPGTGQEFQVRVDTPESRAAHDAVWNWLEARRSGADPGRLQELFDHRQDALSRVQTPEGVEAIRLPEAHRAPDQPTPESPDAAQTTRDEPTAWNDERLAQLPLITGTQAIQAVRDFVMRTRSGLEFTGDPRMLRHAEALRPEAGVVKIALHGLRNGQVIVGRYRMSAENFARGLADLDQRGRINLGNRTIKLISCYSGAGDYSPAATVARILGREVTGATEKMWTYRDGTEMVASPDRHNGRMPKVPADGAERTFGPDGREISTTPADSQPYVGADGRWHASGDRWNSYRTPDGRLHRDGDRAHTLREPGNYRLHHERDTPGTYRAERDFSLRSAETGRLVADPLLDRSQAVRHTAVEGSSETHQSRQSPDEVTRAVQWADAARAAVADFHATRLWPLMDSMGISELEAAQGSNLDRTLAQLRATHAGDPVMLQRIQELDNAAAEHTRLNGVVRSATADVLRAAAVHLLVDRFGLHGDEVAAGRSGQGGRRDSEFAAAGFDQANHRFVIVETDQLGGSRHLLQNGSLAERGTPQHVRDVLETSTQLHDQLRRNQQLWDELHRALARGDLKVEFHRVEVDTSGGQVSITTRQADLTGLNLTGVADRLPKPSKAADPALGQRLYESVQRLAAVFDGTSGQRKGIDQIIVVDERTVEVRPGEGRPFRIDIGTIADSDTPAMTALRDDGVYRVTFAASHLDNLDAVALDLVVTRSLGHVQGEVRATTGGRLGRLVGKHGGRLNSVDALVNEPNPRRRLRPSHADIVHLAEFDALARLHEGANYPQQTAIESELRTFIESRALRDGVPGADVRADLARRHLSEPVSALLDEQRQWWHDSDPVVAGTRHQLTHYYFDLVSVEPVSAWGRTMYRVTPENWADTGRLSFTFEVRAGAVPDGRVVEFRGGGRERHFVLVVDRGSFELGEPRRGRDTAAAEYRFRGQLGRALGELVEMQHARPGEVPFRRIDRLVANTPTIAAAATSIAVATALGMPGLVIRRTTVAAFELATNNRLARYVITDRLENRHDRALAQLPDRTGIAEGELQRRIDASYDRAGELAATLLGDRSAAERTKHPDPETTPDTRTVPESEARPIRNRIRHEIRQISRLLGSEPIEFLEKVRLLDGDRYKLVIRGDAPNAVVHVEMTHTADPNKIEVGYTDERITLKVSPDIDTSTMHTAVRDALTKVAERQHELTRHDAGLRAYLERRVRNERPTAGPVFGTGNEAHSGSGTMQVSATVAKALVQVLVDRFNGLRSREVVDLAERHDLEHWGRLTAAQRRNVGGQIDELATNGRSLARAALDRLDGIPHTSTPTPPAVTAGHDGAVRSVEDGIDRLNDRHESTFGESEQVLDTSGNLVEVVYRSEQPGRGYDVEMRFRFDSVEDGRPIVPDTDRIRRGRFSFIVNVDADPVQIADALTHIGHNTLFDRENRLPTRRWIREDLLPALAQGGAAVATGLLTGSVFYGLLTGVGAAGFLFARRSNRIHQLNVNDLAIILKLTEAKQGTTTPQHLREQIEQQRQPVEELEQRARQIEEQLAADPRTVDAIAQLREMYGNLPTADAHLLPDIDRQVAAFTDLPQGGQIARVADTEHTFRLVFKGAHNRPEQLTFEIRTGLPDNGAPFTAHQVDSDVNYVLRVDPTQTPDQIADAIRNWADQEIHRISQQPTGLPSARARWLTFARDAGSQALASTVSLARAPDGELGRVARRQVAYSNSQLVSTGSRELSNITYDGNEAVTSQSRSELLKRHIVTAAEEHLAAFRADADGLLTRTRWAIDRLQHLEQIAAKLPPADRPTPFQHAPRMLLDEPVAWGEDGTGQPDPAGNQPESSGPTTPGSALESDSDSGHGVDAVEGNEKHGPNSTTSSMTDRTTSGTEKHTDATSSDADTASDRNQTGPSEHHDQPGEPVLTEHSAQPAETGQQDSTSSPAGPAQPGPTAAAVPGSTFHGLGRPTADPAAVWNLARTVFPMVAGAAGVDEIAEVGPGQYEIRPAGSPPIRVRLALGPVDDGAVAQTVRNADGAFTVTLSDRAGDNAVPRALAHEATELVALQAMGQLAAPLEPGNVHGPIDPAGLSAHDHGRVAEIRLLAAQYATADADGRQSIRAELAALTEHLGLVPTSKDAAARQKLLPLDVVAHLHQLTVPPITSSQVTAVVNGESDLTVLQRYRMYDHRARLTDSGKVLSEAELRTRLHELAMSAEDTQASLPRLPAYAGQILRLPDNLLGQIRAMDPQLADQVAREGVYVDLTGRFDLRPYVPSGRPEVKVSGTEPAFDLRTEAGRQSLLEEDRARARATLRAQYAMDPTALTVLSTYNFHYVGGSRVMVLVPDALTSALRTFFPPSVIPYQEGSATKTAQDETIAIAHRVSLPPRMPNKPELGYGWPVDSRTGQPIPLWNGIPGREQAQQGRLRNCPMVAAIGAVASHSPDTILGLFQPGPDGSVDVILHESTPPGERTTPTGRRLRVTVYPEVPVTASSPGQAAYMAQNVDVGSWAAILEKALAAADRTWTDQQREAWQETWATLHEVIDPGRAAPLGYARLGSGLDAWLVAELLTQLTGEPARVAWFDSTPGQEQAVEAWLATLLAAGSPVVVGTLGRDDYPVHQQQKLPHDLIMAHAYEVTKVEGGFVQLHNPWNRRHPSPIPIRSFLDLIAPEYTYLDRVPAPAPADQSPTSPPFHANTQVRPDEEKPGYAFGYLAMTSVGGS